MASKYTRQKVRRQEGPRAAGPAGRPAMEIRCPWCYHKFGECYSLMDYFALKRAGVVLRCSKCHRDKVL